MRAGDRPIVASSRRRWRCPARNAGGPAVAGPPLLLRGAALLCGRCAELRAHRVHRDVEETAALLLSETGLGHPARGGRVLGPERRVALTVNRCRLGQCGALRGGSRAGSTAASDRDLVLLALHDGPTLRAGTQGLHVPCGKPTVECPRRPDVFTSRPPETANRQHQAPNAGATPPDQRKVPPATAGQACAPSSSRTANAGWGQCASTDPPSGGRRRGDEGVRDYQR